MSVKLFPYDTCVEIQNMTKQGLLLVTPNKVLLHFTDPFAQPNYRLAQSANLGKIQSTSLCFDLKIAVMNFIIGAKYVDCRLEQITTVINQLV